jgi:hypothetical protein
VVCVCARLFGVCVVIMTLTCVKDAHEHLLLSGHPECLGVEGEQARGEEGRDLGVGSVCGPDDTRVHSAHARRVTVCGSSTRPSSSSSACAKGLRPHSSSHSAEPGMQSRTYYPAPKCTKLTTPSLRYFALRDTLSS